MNLFYSNYKKIANKLLKINLIFLSCGYSLTLIGSLIYNEIIIFNFCGFNQYTTKILEEKQKEEFLILRRTEMENSHVDNNENNDNNSQNDNDNDNDSENDLSNNSDNNEENV